MAPRSAGIVIALLLAFQAVTAAPYYGKLIGELSTAGHSVAGTVYAVDETRIMVKGFTFDGSAPDTFFWVGVSPSPSEIGEELFLDDGQEPLRPYTDDDVIITMPVGKPITNFKWLSVWCKTAAESFGHVTIAEDLELPAPHNLGELQAIPLQYDVHASEVWILDSQTFMLTNFSYNGGAPDTFFWAGDTATPDDKGFWLFWTNGENQMLNRPFDGENLTVTIPEPTNINDITYFSVWCRTAGADFGTISFTPGELNVPAYIKPTATAYYGVFLGTFPDDSIHELEGDVYAADQKRLIVREFHYDGEGPDAFFWVGHTDVVGKEGYPIYLDDGQEPLGVYVDADLVLTMPNDTKITDFKWLSVWCRIAEANFGHFLIDPNTVLPDVTDIGPLLPLAHEVSAEHVWILDAKTFLFDTLYYDGLGPDAYFWAGTTTDPDEYGFPLTWKKGYDQVIPSGSPFTGQNITVTIPDERVVYDLAYVGLWCVLATQDFGHVKINGSALNIPAYVDSGPAFSNCEELIADEFQVSWQIQDARIEIRLSGRVTTDQYLSFGLSGSDTGTAMVGSDVAVVFERGNGTIEVIDYNLQAKSQCAPVDGSATGACADTVAGGTNDLTLVDFANVDGVREFTYSRSLLADDPIDKEIDVTGNMYISWAVGFINSAGSVAKHTVVPLTDVEIDFGRNATMCTPFTNRVTAPPPLPGWPVISLVDETEFIVEIGQNGGQRGYESLTGQIGWGIAWYVNELLIPEITVVRGTKYSFRVFGGDNPDVSAQYHPFYITDDPIGGYSQQTPAEREKLTIYAGPKNGTYCEWKVAELGASNPDDFDDFPEYKATLERDCDCIKDPIGTVLDWTPDSNTPDLVYYQCYTHRYLGWKIHVVDPPTPPSGGSAIPTFSLAALIGTLLAARLL